jgi:dihydrodipicolinate reductase
VAPEPLRTPKKDTDSVKLNEVSVLSTHHKNKKKIYSKPLESMAEMIAEIEKAPAEIAPETDEEARKRMRVQRLRQ